MFSSLFLILFALYPIALEHPGTNARQLENQPPALPNAVTLLQ
jgi:hypothetical protein